MKTQKLAAAAALALLCTLAFAPEALAADPDAGVDGPPLATTSVDSTADDGPPGNGGEYGAAADPDGLIAASPVDGQGTFSISAWLESAFGRFLSSLRF